MKKYRIGICSPDPEYGTNLMMALSRVSNGEIEAAFYSRPNLILTGIPARKTDLILLEQGEYNGISDPGILEKVKEEAEIQYGIPVCMLSEEPSGTGIFKYQSVCEISQEIRSVLKSVRGVSSQPSGCIAVISPLGRCGKTTLAKALAKEETGTGALYIGMEEYPEVSVHSEILYLIRQRSPECYEAVLREQLHEEGLSLLYVSGVYSELRDVQQRDLEFLREELLQPGRYQRLIFDLGGSALSELSMLRFFDRIYLPVLSDVHSKAKVEHFREVMREMKLEDILRRIQMVELTEDVVMKGTAEEVTGCLG